MPENVSGGSVTINCTKGRLIQKVIIHLAYRVDGKNDFPGLVGFTILNGLRELSVGYR